MKECLDYIKDMAADQEKLYQEIIEQKDINIELEKKNKELEVKISQKDKELERVRDLTNMFWGDYRELREDYEELEAHYKFVVEALAQISPKLIEDMNEDLEESFFSEIISNFRKRSGFW